MNSHIAVKVDSLTCQAEWPGGYRWDSKEKDCVSYTVTGCSAPKNQSTYKECISERITEVGPGSQLVSTAAVVLIAFIAICVFALVAIRRKGTKR